MAWSSAEQVPLRVGKIYLEKVALNLVTLSGVAGDCGKHFELLEAD